MEGIFNGIFAGDLAATISVTDFLLCLGVSLVLGLLLAATFAFRNPCSKSFVLTLALLPAVVCVVIMMVNGNIGAGVAVAGAFSLVRFRSAPGSAKEIVTIFLAMGAGLIAGMGYLGYAAQTVAAGFRGGQHLRKTVKITIPEDLDYTGVFADIFEEYTISCELIQVKTTNMGSMFRLTYEVTLQDAAREKQMIDRIRQRNGNLEVMVSRQETPVAEL